MTEPTANPAQPIPADQQPPAASSLPQVQIAGGVTKTPGGRTLARIDIGYGPASFTMLLDRETCANLSNVIGPLLAEVADAVRRAQLGLHVPDGPVNLPPPPNGRPQGR